MFILSSYIVAMADRVHLFRPNHGLLRERALIMKAVCLWLGANFYFSDNHGPRTTLSGTQYYPPPLKWYCQTTRNSVC